MIHLNTRDHSQNSPNLRRGFFIALCLALFSFSTSFASNNTPLSPIIHGRTIDLKGDFVPYVSLEFTRSNLFLLSDADGYFVYNAPLIQEDSILISRIGFEQKIISAIQLSRASDIMLRPTVLSLETVEIQASIKSSPTALQVMGNYTKTGGSGVVEHSKILGRIPGISIKAYGGPAGISTLSMDGGPSSHTKVLVDGIDITSAQNGEADLSQIPLPFVESMSYIPFDIGKNNHGNTDGTIKLESGRSQNHVSVSQGSYGHVAYDINIGKRIYGLWTALQLGHRSEKGNYPVSWNQQEHTRQNNDLEQDFGAIRIRGMLRSNLFFMLTAMESRQSRGVAGLLWSPDLLSHRNDKLQLIGSTLGWLRLKGTSHLRFSLKRSQEVYSNPSLRLDSNHKLDSYHIELNDQRAYGNRVSLITNVSIDQDNIRSSNTSQHTRNTFGASIAPVILVFNEMSVVPSIKYFYSPDLYERTLTDFQIKVPISNLGPFAEIAASHGSVYRYPSFNDQYWEPGGNPNLEPEKTAVSTAQLQLEFKYWGDLMVQWQIKESSNLIQWMPVHSYWQPGNVLESTRESKKIIWNYEYPKLDISGFAHFSLIQTLDHTLDKPLRYAPDQTSAMGLAWIPGPLEFNIQYNYVSDRISIYDYPEDTIILATGLWTASFAYTWDLRSRPLTLILTGDNLQDTKYETIRGYPEPGRSMRLNARYDW